MKLPRWLTILMLALCTFATALAGYVTSYALLVVRETIVVEQRPMGPVTVDILQFSPGYRFGGQLSRFVYAPVASLDRRFRRDLWEDRDTLDAFIRG